MRKPDDRSLRPAPHLALRVLTLLIFLEMPLKAYADPGSGLLLWQLAGAFFLGVIYHVRKFFSDRKNKK
jgi:hypothetical protein